jgi:hypothetical protein
MMFSKKMAVHALRKWRVAQVFIDVYSHTLLPENLHLLIAVPESFFDADDFGLDEHADRLVPILQVGSEETVLFDDPERNKLVLISVDGPEVRETFFSWQQFLAHFLLTLLENGFDEARTERIATLIEANYPNEVIAFWNHSRILPGRDKTSLRQQFVRSISW